MWDIFSSAVPAAHLVDKIKDLAEVGVGYIYIYEKENLGAELCLLFLIIIFVSFILV